MGINQANFNLCKRKLKAGPMHNVHNPHFGIEEGMFVLIRRTLIHTFA